VIERLFQNDYQGIIAIKSTVVPGTTQSLIDKYNNHKICFVPEFLRERSALVDFMQHQDVLIVGGSPGNSASENVKMSHGNIPKNVVVMSPTEAELAKYFNNVFNALRITFANGFFDVCKEMDCDYQKIIEAMTMRENIDHHYLRASNNLRGFGGYCLPKDTEAFQNLVKNLDLKSTIFQAIIDDNKLYKRTVLEGTRA
jgi:nucleotide sugar dehydrogenase